MFFVHDDIIDLIEHERVNFLSTIEGLPFNIENQIGPGSIDLRLGLSFRRFKKDLKNFDLDTSDDTELIILEAGESITLEANEIILANTLERVFLAGDIGAILTGRSSLSRIGLQINISQDFIQPGYVNTIPLQLVNLHNDKSISIPTILSVCQLVLFSASSNTSIPYSINPDSKYAGETSETEPSKLGIELGTNTQTDFKSKIVTTKLGKDLIDKWNKKLKDEAGNKKGIKAYKNDENEIGIFLKKFMGSPNVADFSGRSTLREDTIFKEIQTFLSSGAEKISLLDVCCGYSSWIELLEKSIPGKIESIDFVGVDGSNDCIKKLKASPWKEKFASFNCEVRSATDLDGLNKKGKFDIVFFSNSMHEIEPNDYPKIFESMNSQVSPRNGKIIITDMEELPEREVESIAINWKGEEVEEMLRAAGFNPSFTRHQKEVSVFQVTTSHCEKFNSAEMFKKIRELLIQKRLSNIELLEHIESEPKETTLYRIQWLKQIAIISQISKAVKKIKEINP